MGSDIQLKLNLFYSKYAFIFEIISLLIIFPLVYIDFRVGIGYILILSSVWYYQTTNKVQNNSTTVQSETEGYLSEEDLDQESIESINNLIENQDSDK